MYNLPSLEEAVNQDLLNWLTGKSVTLSYYAIRVFFLIYPFLNK
jgi:hypothetical protein